MKTTHKVFALSVSMLLFAACGNKEHNLEETEKTEYASSEKKGGGGIGIAATPMEDKIDLSNCALDEIEGDNQIIVCGTYLKINNHPVDTTPINRILHSSFDTLRIVALSMLPAGTSRYITALKMSFAVKSGSVTLVYTPVALALTDDLYDGHLNHLATYSVHTPTYSYMYNTAQRRFDLVPVTMHAGYTDEYKTAMKLMHCKNQPLKAFDSLIDATSVIFPFQEIDQLVCDNQQANYINVFNAIRRFNTDTGLTYKHSVLLSSNDLKPLVEEAAETNTAVPGCTPSSIFVGKYANLAHMCPPSCGKPIYVLK